jgi:hypothetical protein
MISVCSQAIAQLALESLPNDVRNVIERHHSFVSQFDIGYLKTRERADYSNAHPDVQGKSEKLFEIWLGPTSHRSFVKKFGTRSKLNVTLADSPLPFISQSDSFRDRISGMSKGVACYDDPANIDRVTPCVSNGVYAGEGRSEDFEELSPLSGLMLRIPSAPIPTSLMDLITGRPDAGSATEVVALPREKIGDVDCQSLKITVLRPPTDSGEQHKIEFVVWIDGQGMMRQFMLNLLPSGDGVVFCHVDAESSTALGVVVPKVVRYYLSEDEHTKKYLFGGRMEAQGQGWYLIHETELLEWQPDVEKVPEFKDTQFGFRFPRNCLVTVSEFDAKTAPLDYKPEKVVYGQTNDEILLRTRENRIWLDNWCRENGFPGDPGRIMPDAADDATNQGPVPQGQPELSAIVVNSRSELIQQRVRSLIAWGVVVACVVGISYWRVRRNRNVQP